MRRHWFFDLDGTLARTGEDIREAWIGALKRLGRDVSRFDEVFSIGPTIEKVTYDLYGDATPGLVRDVIDNFRPLYDDGGFPNTVAYDGIGDFLSMLKNAGARIYIVTNKRHAPTVKMAEKFGWDAVFDGIWSHDTFEVKYSKPDLMARLLRELGVDPADAVMVGDTAGDVETGRRNGMATVAVAYGYGTREELSGADYVCESVAELSRTAPSVA
jgi:phosphoglycolate phosphatase